MDLIDLVRVLLRRWWLILIPTVIAAGLTIPSLFTMQSTVSGGFSTRFSYSAAQNLEAIPRSEGDYQDIWLSSELTVNALTDWITSSSFADEVAAHLQTQGLELPAGSLIGRFAADNERSIGQVFISWSDETQLAAIAAAAIAVLETRNADYFAQLGGTPAMVTLLDAPRIAPAPPPLTDRFGPFIRIGLGLIAGLALALLAHAFDPMLRRKQDVEALGLPVITTIPRR
jgi:capsular polysaccharide biosynthesis protein